jgi:AraC-like DNA-binding protein
MAIKKITTYSIQNLQKVFNLSSNKKDFFFVEIGNGNIFNPEPRRSETYSISFIKAGEVLFQAGLRNQIITGPAMVTLGPTVVRSLQEGEKQPIMDIIFFTDDYLMENRSNVFYLMEFDFFENEELHYIPLDKVQATTIERIYTTIKETLKTGNHYHEREIIRSCIFLLIHEANAFNKHRQSPNDYFTEKMSPLLVNFKQLLHKEYRRERSVKFYADKLNITAKHLSDLLKKQTGKTAGEWIDESIVLEAKVLLQNKTLSVSDISDELNFSDQSVFGKFFKTHTSLTPLQYRKSAM